MNNKSRAKWYGLLLFLTAFIAFVCTEIDRSTNAQDIKGGAGEAAKPSNSNSNRNSLPRQPSSKRESAVKPKSTQPTAANTQLDALAIPAGFMSGRGSPENFISLGADSKGCHTGTDCIKVTYEVGGEWGGIYWWPQSCGASGTDEAWGKVRNGTCGIDILKASGLSAVKKLTFWVKGERGGETVEFKVGASDLLPSPGRSLGKVTLTSAWKQYEIDLKGISLNKATALFALIAIDKTNAKGAVFYLDDIQFEGVR
jgi:hypothetical protein